MKTLFAAILVALMALTGCDAGSDMGFDPDVSVMETGGDTEADQGANTEIGFADGSDEAHEVADDESASPVAVSVGVDIRLTFACNDKTGYNWHPNLHVIQGDHQNTLDEFHGWRWSDNDSFENITEGLYKGSEPYEGHAMLLCQPNSGINTYVVSFPFVPTHPNGYLVSVDSWEATTEQSPPWMLYTPDTTLTAEIWCRGIKVGTKSWNPSEMGLSGYAALDVFFLDTSKGGACDVTTYEPLTPYCGGSTTQCASEEN